MSLIDEFSNYHAKYENRAYRILLREFRKILKDIPYRNITLENAETFIMLNVNEESLRKALLKVYLLIGNSYGTIISQQLKSEQKRRFPLFSEAFQSFIISYMQSEGFSAITLLTQTMAKEVAKKVIELSKSGIDVFTLRKEIQKIVNKPDFYKWQALRIARTETTFAMNSSKEIAGEVSGLVLDKIWLGRNDGRERPSHVAMNNKMAGQNELFKVGGSLMKYPGDKNGSVEEVVNCRCTFAYKVRRDANGNLIYR